MLQTLLQTEDQQHESDCDDEGDGFRPFQDDFGGGHGDVFQVAVVGHVDCDGPVLFLDELFDVGDTVGDHVVEHEGVETCDAFLGC